MISNTSKSQQRFIQIMKNKGYWAFHAVSDKTEKNKNRTVNTFGKGTCLNERVWNEVFYTKTYRKKLD